MFLEPNGRDWSSIVNWDDVGKIYAAIIVIWTSILLFGIIWLILHRRLPFIRIRNLPLAITSTAFLHIYLVKIWLAYTTNGHFACSAEFWIMSIYLPFGIALLQAYLTQLRSVWEQQQRLLLRSSDGTCNDAKTTNPLQRWQNLSRLHKSYILIGIGMLIQLIITAVLYATTPTLQGDWSSYGKIPHAKGQSLCRKSLQWIPSAFWQLFWSWFYGPYILIEVRHIRDIHFWRAQIIICVLSSLPGTPLWLAALYSPHFKAINSRFVPPMWLAPGIMVMQFVTIFFPVFESWKRKHDMRNTLSTLHEWDGSTRCGSIDTSSYGRATSKVSVDQSIGRSSIVSVVDTRVNTLAALRKVLTVNPTPLLEFATTKEFSAENILFLTEVRRWRSKWAQEVMTPAGEDSLFAQARHIYITLVNNKTAEFPINIESRIRTGLDAIFKPALPEADGRDTDPFEVPSSAQNQTMPWFERRKRTSEGEWFNDSLTVTSDRPMFRPHPCVEPLGKARAIIRPEFGKHVFDEAEESIEYLVLTNTWQKFVKEESVRIDKIER